MRDDQIVFREIGWFPDAQVGDFRREAGGVARRGSLQGLDHARAAVDGSDFEMGIFVQQVGGETAVSVAENEGAAAVG